MPDEYIKRSDALKVLCDKCVFESHCSRKNEFCDQIQGIKAIPAADVEPVRHGRWIPINRSNPAWGLLGIAQHKCSECGSEEMIARKRCPECGAKMEV